MNRGNVLVIEDPRGLGAALAPLLRARSFNVEIRPDARSGFNHACSSGPDCVVACTELSDIDGYWVARRLRTEAAAVSRTPIILLGGLNDVETRREAFNAGADVVFSLPVELEDVVLQVEALVSMARRYEVVEGPRSSVDAAIGGDLATFPLASVLMMFELERRSGIVDVTSSGGSRARLKISYGMFAAAELAGDEQPSLVVLREVLMWRAGIFKFRSAEADQLPAPRETIGALILEAMRLQDEGEASTSFELALERMTSAPPPPAKPSAPTVAPPAPTVAPPAPTVAPPLPSPTGRPRRSSAAPRVTSTPKKPEVPRPPPLPKRIK